MKKLSENPVLMYKNQKEESSELNKEDFVLIIMSKFQKKMLKKLGAQTICIDGTHGTNQYKYQLYTLLTIDEWGEGFPAAFCISNREDEAIFKVFFSRIKQEVGVIQTDLFMSDGAAAFYNAWRIVMGEPKKRLLCLWHVHKNWVLNQKKIKCDDKKKLVMKSLKSIAEELNEEAFETEFQKLLTDLDADTDTNEFGKYLRENYEKIRRSWARCYRRNVPINTNMSLEALHRSLKYDYLDGKKCFRIDRTVHELLSIIRDKRFNRIRKIAKQTPYKNISNIKASHAKSLDYLDDVQPHLEQENTWIVKQYVVLRQQTEINSCCRRKCDICEICVHTYICTCKDNTLSFNICKHIHAVATKYPIGDLTAELEMEIIETESDNINLPSTSCRSSTDITNEVMLKNGVIYGILKTKNLSPDEGEEILKLQNKMLEILRKSDKFPFPIQCQDSRGKIEKQSYFPTRKISKKKPATLPYVSRAAMELIQQGFSSQNNEVAIIHEEFDHQYIIETPTQNKSNTE
ncbi:uncharacterized protein LOC135845143 [Planococcus citri]|uniref:uncharacterized protein LOC135845143 n=1 Tax=Planococcus citri TaxID=170843 RepID=UPI0031FA1C86